MISKRIALAVVLLSATILSHEKDSEAVQNALSALSQARHVSLPAPARATTAGVDQAAVKIPKQGWSIFFESPPLSKKEESKKADQYAFRANSGRFNISLFVEEPRGKGASHRDCQQFYWRKANQNPMIAKDTVRTSETDTYVRVEYDVLTEFVGKPIRQRNVNYYFVYRDRWIDVHISIIQPTEEDEAIFTAFDNSLRYGG